jgi:hypothetical protein
MLRFLTNFEATFRRGVRQYRASTIPALMMTFSTFLTRRWQHETPTKHREGGSMTYEQTLALVSASIAWLAVMTVLWRRDTIKAIGNERKAKEEGRI